MRLGTTSKYLFVAAFCQLAIVYQAAAQQPAANSLEQNTPPVGEVCLTNACSEGVTAPVNDPAAIEAAKAAAEQRGRAQVSKMMALTRTGAFTNLSSKMPEGFRVDLSTTLVTANGESLPLTIKAAPGGSSFAGSDPSRTSTDYLIGAVVDVSGNAVAVNAAFQINGATVIVPRQDLTLGNSGSVALPDGSRLTMTATLRPETAQEKASSQLVRNRLATRP